MEFAVGDKVSVIPSFMFDQYGMYGELVNAPSHNIVKHPQNLSFEQAAASWMMFITAYGALIEYGHLKQDQFVLVNASSSSVGIAAIQISNMMGAYPIALTRTRNKMETLLNSGAHAVIITSEQDITQEIHKLTNNRGVDIVFDPIGGPNVAKITPAMAMNSIFFQYGALETQNLSIPVMDILGKHLTFRGYELFEITTNPKKMQKAKEFVYNGLKSEQLKPIISKIFSFDEIRKAHQYMEANSQIGKIVVKI
ncbi:zinc-dependent alcohol dehydrogenase family protein [Commensalibacter oyaizuii]|uniref:Zinc-dependent alcohol dehydrogenase family protein n=1 Tax=Commensalibacter oyaizuii TaxID=3043873 RepID=A0ABT6PYP2_9PROT|nr:zinc-dependent alcohol dehydrogenase family protein [Commensalibacter sp. TBRC 16381]MDI2089845.1 zinc-dependent alcohol dehydrogenase family protein [Commensalibacter sp. TBRC 16381]